MYITSKQIELELQQIQNMTKPDQPGPSSFNSFRSCVRTKMSGFFFGIVKLFALLLECTYELDGSDK